MQNYGVAQLDEIGEIDDGRSPFRPVRHHLGIRAFGVNAFGPRPAGVRLINEHDEAEPDAQEELYVVIAGRARFEIDGETVNAPVGSLIFAKPGVSRVRRGGRHDAARDRREGRHGVSAHGIRGLGAVSAVFHGRRICSHSRPGF
jgi:hypothetical protein